MGHLVQKGPEAEHVAPPVVAVGPPGDCEGLQNHPPTGRWVGTAGDEEPDVPKWSRRPPTLITRDGTYDHLLPAMTSGAM